MGDTSVSHFILIEMDLVLQNLYTLEMNRENVKITYQLISGDVELLMRGVLYRDTLKNLKAVTPLITHSIFQNIFPCMNIEQNLL